MYNHVLQAFGKKTMNERVRRKGGENERKERSVGNGFWSAMGAQREYQNWGKSKKNKCAKNAGEPQPRSGCSPPEFMVQLQTLVALTLKNP